jgi:hypothetical protein
MNCTPGASNLFVSGEWFDAIVCWLTGGLDPTLSVVIPTFMFGAILSSYFIVGSSPIIPAVISIIFAGVLFVSFPASATTLIMLLVLFALAGGMLLTSWRLAG